MSLFLSTILCLALCCTPDNKDNPDDQPGNGPGEEVPVLNDGSVKIYDAPPGLQSNVCGSLHKVAVNGQKCFVFRTEATGGGMEYGQVFPEYAFFDFEELGRVEIVVEAAYDVHDVEILPSRHGIVPIVEGRKISFEISAPGQYYVKTGGDHSNGCTSDNNLYIFANPKETDIPDKDDPNVVWFKPGVYPHKEYRVESGKTYYLDAGAFVYGRFYGDNVRDVRICGRGTLCGEMLTDMGDPGRALCFKNMCDNITVEGINVMHSKVWQVAFFQSTNIHIDNIHAISHGQSSDGVDITGCKHVLVENSFFRGHDDILAVKAKVWGAGPKMDCKDVTFRNCVAWSDSSNPMTIGYETAQNVKEILYEKIDVLSMSMPPVWRLEAVMAIEPHGMDGTVGNVTDVTYRDIRVDLSVPQNSLFRLVVDDGGHIRDIKFEDVFVNYGGTLGGLIMGSGQYLVDGVSFSNVRNSDGVQLSMGKITTNSLVRNVSVTPEAEPKTIVGESWDFSNEFGGLPTSQGMHNWYFKASMSGGAHDMYCDGRNWIYDGACKVIVDRMDHPSYGWNYTYWEKWSAGMVSSLDKKACVIWKAPADGTVNINVKARKWQTGGDGVIISILKNNDKVIAAKGLDAASNSLIEFHSDGKSVSKGDEIWFVLDPRATTDADFTQIVPVITYTSVK